MIYKSEEKSQEYVAPILGNGTVCIQADYEGCMADERRTDKISCNPSMRIWRAGRRQYDNTLLPFGSFGHSFKNSKMLEKYSQQLDTQNALVKTKCEYNGGTEIESIVSVHHDFDLIMINRRIFCSQNLSYCFEYVTGNDKKDFWIDEITEYDDGIDIEYSAAKGQRGIISLFSDEKTAVHAGNGTFSLECDISQGEKEVTFYILFCDNITSKEYLKDSEEIKSRVKAEGYNAFIKRHVSQWKKYYSEGYAVTDDQELNAVYNTAQYHIKCYTTPWSVPVGLCDALWHGKYFAFDEFYMLMPLLSSNHMNAAYKIPHFRAEGLEKAIKRASSPHSVRQARYPWETLENGDEGASPGYWHDHVFHMACIAMAEYYYYKYTDDKNFLLKEGYPVIKACAMFYINHMLYETSDGHLKVSKCTDMERLGASVPNGYMTSCGIIKTIRIFCETAHILGLDEADKYLHLADRLYASLPNDGFKYIPHDGCADTSIGLMGGTYPFDIMDKNNTLQKNGIKSYLSQENAKGNMYAVGSGACPWYKVWKAIVLGRLGKADEAYCAIKDAANNTGNFKEMYEINDLETGTIFRPWFGTASGMFIQAVNEMLVRSEDGILYIGAALPKKIKAFSFKLAAYGGIVVEAEIYDNRIKTLRLTSKIKKGCVDVAVRKHLISDEINGEKLREHGEEYYLIRCAITEE